MFKLIKSIFKAVFYMGFLVSVFLLFTLYKLAVKSNEQYDNETTVEVNQPNTKNDWIGRMCGPEDEALLKECKRIATKLGYDPDEIDEAYYTKRLIPEELGRQKTWSNYDLIVINESVKSENKHFQLANLVHEVIHVYTGNDLRAWHRGMERAVKYFPECSYYLKQDMLYDHPID